MTQDTIALDIVDPEVIDPSYLYWQLRTPVYRAYCRAHGTGTTNLDLSQENFLAYEIPLPSLSQQRYTTLVLGALDDKIAANRRSVDVGRSLLLARWEALTRTANESGTLEDVVEISPRLTQRAPDIAPYLDMANLPEHGLLVTDWATRAPRGGARFRNGDTLVARITPCFENGKIGFVDFLGDTEIGYGSTEYIVLRARPGIPSLVPYVIAASSSFRAFAAQHRTGTSGRQRVQAKELASFPVPLPSAAAMEQFGASSDTLVRRLGAARNENQRLAATRDELLPLLMSGRITVKDAEARVGKEV